MIAASIVGARTGVAQISVASADDSRNNTRYRDELLARKVTVDIVGASRTKALDLAAAASKVTVQYQMQMFDAYPASITIRAKRSPLHDVLDQVLAGTPFLVVADGPSRLAIVRAFAGSTDSTKTGTVRGRVVDSASGAALASVTITVDGDKKKPIATSGADGKFSIGGLSTGEHTLSFKLLGYRIATQRATVRDNENAILMVTLATSTTMLTQVVTTATGVQRRLDVGNAITTINVDEVRKNAPVSTVTDLLDGRVPDLVVTRGSGAPGSASRIRIRGNGSVSASNDPIIVIDGVRQYSNQTTSQRDAEYSVLDHIDLDAVATVDILKGPSASSLYGSDAANGVIVITTKKGTPGKTRWSFATDQMVTTQPQTFPEQAITEGYANNGGLLARCALGGIQPCLQARAVRYNPLGDEQTTILGTGYNQAYRGNVSGGVSAVQYFISLNTIQDLGLTKMSDADVQYLKTLTGKSIPAWQRRPQSSRISNATSRISIQVTPALSTDLSSSLDKTDRSNTPLGNALQFLQTSALPTDTSLVGGRVANFRERDTWHELTWRNIANATWTPLSWLNTHGDAGLTTSNRETDALLRRGDCQGCSGGDGGFLNSGRDTRSVGAVNAWGSVKVPSRFGLRINPLFGFNYVRTLEHDTQIQATTLALGSSSVSGAQTVTVTDTGGTPVQFGVYVSTTFSILDRWSTTFGFRTDASNALGKNVSPTYPKLDLSYIVPAERFFSSSALSLLRVRVAYGHAAVQPELGASLRTYQPGLGVVPGGNSGAVLNLSTLGNPDLRPERSTELEGGFDTRFANDRIALSMTGHRKLSRDALIQVTRPPSVGEGSLTTNLGSVRNAGGDVSVEALVFDRPNVSWNVTGMYSRNVNTLVSIAPTFDRGLQLGFGATDIYGRRYVEGYPLSGVWLRPVVGYSDQNHDGIVGQDEIIRSDSSIFVGGPLPKYTLTMSSTLGLWRNRLTLAINTQYQNGTGQVNQALLESIFGNNGFATVPALADPNTPIEEQVALRSGYSLLHPVTAFRIQSLSVRMALPDRLAHRLARASSMSVALQATNLGLWTNYSGSDPNVTSSIVGNSLFDNGSLPQPRTMGLNVTLNY